MTDQTILVIVLTGIAYVIWIISLVRQKRLHVSFATVWAIWGIIGIIFIISRPLLSGAARIIGAQLPVDTLSFLAMMVLFAMQVYLFSQITLLSNRISAIAQHIAYTEAEQDQ